MKLPAGVTFHFAHHVYQPGDDIPPELEARIPEEIRLQAARVRAAPEPEVHDDAPVPRSKRT